MFTLNGKYTDAVVYTDICEQQAISQIIRLCNHPVFDGAKIRIMPDVHAGIGCTIGTTIKLKEKKLIPNIVGVDIGCGVLTTIFKTSNSIDFKKLDDFIKSNIPNGHGVQKRKHPNLDKNIQKQIKEIVNDLNLKEVDYFINSYGSLGGGNHYIEIGQIDDDTYALSVHTGSRNLGKKVSKHFSLRASFNMAGGDKLKKAEQELISNLKKQNREKDINKELINLKNNFSDKIIGIPKDLAYIEGKDYEDYIENMIKCQNMAFENRRLISQDILDFLKIEAIDKFDTVHNYIEDADGCIIIRKGSISAKKGEKVAIPLNMKEGVIIALGKGNDDWNQSAPHGAGRLLSRSEAKELLSMDDFKDDMNGINTWSVCEETLDEAPQAYKPADLIIEQVKETVDILYIAKPVYNFKSKMIRK